MDVIPYKDKGCIYEPDVNSRRTKMYNKIRPREMDPLVLRIHVNMALSFLYRLPDAILLKIMGRLDFVSIQILRRTCRVFLRLFNAPGFQPYRNPEMYLTNNLRPQFQPWVSPHIGRMHQEMKLLISRDLHEYCKACQEARRGPSGDDRFQSLIAEHMHCSGCHADHPRGLFSTWQRLAPAKSRICIGHEGYVRLCSHSILPWSAVMAAGASATFPHIEAHRTNATREIVLRECRHDSHFLRANLAVVPLSIHKTHYKVLALL